MFTRTEAHSVQVPFGSTHLLDELDRRALLADLMLRGLFLDVRIEEVPHLLLELAVAFVVVGGVIPG